MSMPTYTCGINHIMIFHCYLNLFLNGNTYRTLKLIMSKKELPCIIIYAKRD